MLYPAIQRRPFRQGNVPQPLTYTADRNSRRHSGNRCGILYRLENDRDGHFLPVISSERLYDCIKTYSTDNLFEIGQTKPETDCLTYRKQEQ